MSTLRKHPLVALAMLVFALVALTQQPDRSAEAVSNAWDGVSGGTTSFVDSFFTFTESLGSGS
ncbi:hypothetical protein [Sporichthya sp.]|uniref:hypothetical protein n=1 Tax=Sporichthya sp. TaxID=65475 RepID=UPI001852436D|nr:hypothetical protein [Sporichthya sp.]MBA3742079.1 hypothetical protein [Sporichthya sp.]